MPYLPKRHRCRSNRAHLWAMRWRHLRHLRGRAYPRRNLFWAAAPKEPGQLVWSRGAIQEWDPLIPRPGTVWLATIPGHGVVRISP